MKSLKDYAASVFINCPFDGEYQPLFWATTYAVIDCGFIARSALEIDDGTEVRINKIERIIEGCKFGIHDISRTELDPDSELPRFNMPLELGIFLGSKRFGTGRQKDKRCVILDREPYRYQQFISDIAGQEVRSHNDDPDIVISKVSAFLRNASGRTTIPGGAAISGRYRTFNDDLPGMLVDAELHEDEMGFNEFSNFASIWVGDLVGRLR